MSLSATVERVMPMLETNFGKWQGGPAPQHTTMTAPALPAARQIYLVDKPGAPQSQVRIGWVGVARSTPDYFPITVMNTVLGGSSGVGRSILLAMGKAKPFAIAMLVAGAANRERA